MLIANVLPKGKASLWPIHVFINTNFSMWMIERDIYEVNNHSKHELLLACLPLYSIFFLVSPSTTWTNERSPSKWFLLKNIWVKAKATTGTPSQPIMGYFAIPKMNNHPNNFVKFFFIHTIVECIDSWLWVLLAIHGAENGCAVTLTRPLQQRENACFAPEATYSTHELKERTLDKLFPLSLVKAALRSVLAEAGLLIIHTIAIATQK